MTQRSSMVLALCLGLIVAVQTGCRASLDSHSYSSTPLMPVTVTVVDTGTGESLWAMDVPVNQKLRVRFYDDRRPEDAAGNRTAMMRWELTDPEKKTGKLRNEIAVPPASSRRIDMTLRESPEYASSGAYVPAVRTPESANQGDGLLPSETAPSEGNTDNPPSLDPVVIPDRDG